MIINDKKLPIKITTIILSKVKKFLLSELYINNEINKLITPQKI